MAMAELFDFSSLFGLAAADVEDSRLSLMGRRLGYKMEEREEKKKF